MSEYRLIMIKCPQCTQKNRMDMTRISKAKCGECGSSLVGGFSIVTLNCSKCSRENHLYTVEVNQNRRCRYCKEPLIYDSVHTSSPQVPVNNPSTFYDQGCNFCGKSVNEKYRITNDSLFDFQYEKYKPDFCDDCFLEGTANKWIEERILQERKPLNLLENALGSLFGGVWVVGGIGFATYHLGFKDSHPEYYPMILTTTIFLIIVYSVISFLKEFRVKPNNEPAKNFAANELRAANEENSRVIKWIQDTERKRKYREKVERSGIDSIDQMSGLEFEERLYHLFISLGYRVEKTPASGDQGADLIISKGNKKAAVQAKCYSLKRKVSNKAVQEAIAGKQFYKCTDAWVVTNTYFTDPAIDLAKKTDVTLVDRSKLINLLDKQAIKSSDIQDEQQEMDFS
ncbi:restriction endonuclease [Ammoniphilus resinae]|uniref:HJR/Mrr/RecB family endonuclease n=1 Tax=Ammoniphilus resinae TaxID=861532 RepID=A0ABS4GP10_9BACL|nr:restriction endonuclease [Ammoniphilus resinae]MBP1931966.1 HJR/Mrr/RecB family endonuclease [Ammoniphilus resinae]